MTDEDLFRWFGPYREASTYARRHAHESVRTLCRTVAQHLLDTLPAGAERDQTIVHLRQVVFWADASIGLHSLDGDD